MRLSTPAAFSLAAGVTAGVVAVIVAVADVVVAAVAAVIVVVVVDRSVHPIEKHADAYNGGGEPLGLEVG